MTRFIIIGVLGIAILAFTWFAGYSARDAQAKREAEIARRAFERTVSEANNAYANQKAIDDQELEALRQQATTAPANPTIAIKKDMTSRIGVIR